MSEIGKICCRCKRCLGLDQFSNCNTKSSDGKQSTCKPCMAAYAKRHQEAKSPEQRERERLTRNSLKRKTQKKAYASKPTSREKKRETNRRWNARHKEKMIAHYTAGNMIARGKLERKPCEVCGFHYAEAHHDDYTKPAEVRFLCKEHHEEWHRFNKALTSEDYATKEPPPHGGVIPPKEEPK